MLTNEEKYIFTSELAFTLRNGLSIEEGLKMLIGNDQHISKCSKLILNDIEKGITFYEALKNLNEFDDYMIQMVYVGLSIGNLDVIFHQLSQYYDRQKKLSYQIKDAITYPFVLVLMMFIIVSVIVFKVFPIFENILSQMSMSLSLMITTKIISYVGLALLFIVLLFGIFLYLFYRTKKKVWLMKKLNVQIQMTKLTYLLSLFVSSGYSLLDALDIIRDAIEDETIKDKILRVKNDMIKGESLASSLVKENVYPNSYGSLIVAASQSGHEDEILTTLSIRYQEDLERMISSFLNRLEPMMIAGLSLLVGFVLISVMLPLMNVLKTLG